ncbi:polyamine aminopropyltransferase [Hippea maritima]|uniref:Polyamine aminopropyltransferase n=1 Tax=Hippea maritima (strain ATCC 700847 / DSM 10411 / MH2) TaxID=760142 RepID=F2LTV9_HIPMA|nr:polyamine aminopropyltransferase [Hippea maritima]AEA34485.1 Spermidine synthase [Hippea maritima DSM 10411]
MAYFPEFWFTEKYTGTCGFTFKIKRVLSTEQSPLQRLDILETYDFGRVMLLDGLVMFTERDEFVYHEMIAHLPLFAASDPKDVLIIGGGDGGTAREVSKHIYLNSITNVEIDEVVVKNSKKYTPFVGCGFDNEKVNLIIGDGIEFVKDKKGLYNVVIIDSTDPFGPAEGLFNSEFYGNVRDALRDGGIVVAQAENTYYDKRWMMRSVNNMKKAFGKNNVAIYQAAIPTYPSGTWVFAIGWKSGEHPRDRFDEERFNKLNLKLKYYNPEIHKAAFALPSYVEEILKG